MYLTDELFHAEWVPLIALDQIVKRYMQGIGYVDQQVKGIPAGVITRKDALVRDDIIAAREQWDMGAVNYSQSGRNGAAEQSAGWHS